MKIISITDKDGDGFEYEVIISDGKHNILCFADTKLNSKHEFNLLVPLIESIQKSKNNSISILKAKEYFGYYITAEVINIELGVVKVFGFELELGEKIPYGVSNGDLVDVHCIRIDCQGI